MTLPLMPKATAVWLIENSTLTFDQIAVFCGMHPLEVKGIADGEVAQGIVGLDPVSGGQLTHTEITRCEQNKDATLQLSSSMVEHLKMKKKTTSKYTPVARRRDKPDAIAWFVKNHPEVNDAQIAKLVGTTKTTIGSIRSRHHWNSSNIRPRDPVLLGLCTQMELNFILSQVKVIDKAKTEEEQK